VTEPNAPHVQPHLQEELLHRYFDGELRSTEAETVRGHLASCEHCAARHTALSSLQRMITTAAEHASLEVDFDRAFARIEREVRAEARAKPEGLFERLTAWVQKASKERPELIWAPALGAVAAAALLVVLGRDGGGSQVATPTDPAVEPATEVAVAAGNGAQQGTAGSQPAAGLPEGALAMASSELVQVDFGGGTGAVFEVAVADGVSTPVIWINE
jgi:anti-sigma factor RsiW